MTKLALGCSHTYGIGVDSDQAWPNLLGATNCGVPGCSSDLIARTLPDMLVKYQPSVVYVLWPDWTRFEYQVEGLYKQSLPTDFNRIHFMEMATDAWLKSNFKKQQSHVQMLCKDIKLIELTLDELIQYIDHSDRWPKTTDGTNHYNHEWHQWVADIFNGKA